MHPYRAQTLEYDFLYLNRFAKGLVHADKSRPSMVLNVTPTQVLMLSITTKGHDEPEENFFPLNASRLLSGGIPPKNDEVSRVKLTEVNIVPLSEWPSCDVIYEIGQFSTVLHGVIIGEFLKKYNSNQVSVLNRTEKGVGYSGPDATFLPRYIKF